MSIPGLGQIPAQVSIPVLLELSSIGTIGTKAPSTQIKLFD